MSYPGPNAVYQVLPGVATDAARQQLMADSLMPGAVIASVIDAKPVAMMMGAHSVVYPPGTQLRKGPIAKGRRYRHDALAVNAAHTHRRIRKAEVAREGRMRKKRYIQSLEEQVKDLTEELEQAKKKSRDFSEKIDETSPYRRLNIALELTNRLHDAVAPTAKEKLTLWGLDQNNEFFHQQGGLWESIMMDKCRLTEVQTRNLMEFRPFVRQTRQEIEDLHEEVNALRHKIDRHLSFRNVLFRRIRRALTPEQLGQFCVFADTNHACMQMLNTVWAPVKYGTEGATRERASPEPEADSMVDVEIGTLPSSSAMQQGKHSPQSMPIGVLGQSPTLMPSTLETHEDPMFLG